MIDEGSVKRFRAKFTPGSLEDCWDWQGSINGEGYGAFRVRRPDGGWTNIGAHRFAAALAGMPINGNLICHKCDNRRCVNPTHFFVGTQIDNSHDRMEKGRNNHKEHNRGRKDHGAWKRIPDDHVPTIMDRFKNGETQATIAREYGVTHAAINHIVRGRRRTHLLDEAA